jgi:hypothetical protein
VLADVLLGGRIQHVPLLVPVHEHDDNRGMGKGQGGDNDTEAEDRGGASMQSRSQMDQANISPFLTQVEYPFDLGVLKNIRSVLGQSVFGWCIPARTNGDGLRFDVSKGIGMCKRAARLSSPVY